MPEFKVRGKPYNFKVLSQEDQDEILVEFLEAQERDLFCHQINLERYQEMLETLEPGPWRDRILQLKQETESRLEEVESIIEATLRQLPPPERLEAAKQRVKEKRARLIR